MTLQLAGTKSVSVQCHTTTSYVTNAGTAQATIDTLGYEYASIDVCLGASNTTSNAPSVVKLGEAEVTNTSSMADIVAFTGKTATATDVGFLIPVTGVLTATSNVNMYRLNVDLRGRKRYLMVTVNPVTTQPIWVNARLGRGNKVPVTASDYGVLASADG